MFPKGLKLKLGPLRNNFWCFESKLKFSKLNCLKETAAGEEPCFRKSSFFLVCCCRLDRRIGNTQFILMGSETLEKLSIWFFFKFVEAHFFSGKRLFFFYIKKKSSSQTLSLSPDFLLTWCQLLNLLHQTWAAQHLLSICQILFTLGSLRPAKRHWARL